MEIMKKKKQRADLIEQMNEKHQTSVDGVNEEKQLDMKRVHNDLTKINNEDKQKQWEKQHIKQMLVRCLD